MGKFVNFIKFCGEIWANLYSEICVNFAKKIYLNFKEIYSNLRSKFYQNLCDKFHQNLRTNFAPNPRTEIYQVLPLKTPNFTTQIRAKSYQISTPQAERRHA